MKTKTITKRKDRTREINTLIGDKIVCFVYQKFNRKWNYITRYDINFKESDGAELFFKSIKRKPRYKSVGLLGV